VDIEIFFNRVSLEMADCFDVDSTMTVTVTKSAGKPNGENRKVRTSVVLLLQMDISRLSEFIFLKGTRGRPRVKHANQRHTGTIFKT
jgi:hypothetical protein